MQVKPSINEIAFDCPHCGAYTSQRWWALFADRMKDGEAPSPPGEDWLKDIDNDATLSAESKERFRRYIKEIQSGLVFWEPTQTTCYSHTKAENLHLSECFVCKKIAVWVHDRCLFPSAMQADNPNPDLPEDVRMDYEEAGRVLGVSPRGAAALLRLAIQKLCIHLGEKDTIDKAIANLVKKGLLPLVQQSLDAVRVIGNEAVHPGVMDLRDDGETAGQLFKLVNVIAEQMFSTPKHVAEVYGKLPSSKVKAIEARDKAAKPTAAAD